MFTVPGSRKCTNFGILVFLAIGFAPLLAQTTDSSTIDRDHSRRHHGPITLSVHDGLSVVAVARHLNHLPGLEGGDCSHLVNMVYDKAGFPYKYANSFDLYRGIDAFERVRHPQPGDLIVWLCHAGIVINPRHHLFFSALRDGPKMVNYDTNYWKRRGLPHFFRYIKRTDS